MVDMVEKEIDEVINVEPIDEANEKDFYWNHRKTELELAWNNPMMEESQKVFMLERFMYDLLHDKILGDEQVKKYEAKKKNINEQSFNFYRDAYNKLIALDL